MDEWLNGCPIFLIDAQRASLNDWSAQRFARWLDGLYGYLRSRAERGDYALLARTVVRSRVKRDGNTDGGYALERCGGMYGKIEWRGQPGGGVLGSAGAVATPRVLLAHRVET